MNLDFYINMLEGLIPAVIALVFLGIFDHFSNKRKNARIEKLRSEFNKKVVVALENNYLANTKQIKRIYASTVNKHYYYLEQWILQLLTELKSYDNLDDNHYSILEKIIEEIEFEDPFSSLPEEESDLLKNIVDYKDKDSEIFKKSVQNLSKILKKRYEKENRLAKQKMYLTVLSVILGVIGVFK